MTVTILPDSVRGFTIGRLCVVYTYISGQMLFGWHDDVKVWCFGPIKFMVRILGRAK